MLHRPCTHRPLFRVPCPKRWPARPLHPPLRRATNLCMYSLKHMAALLIGCARRRGGFSQHFPPPHIALPALSATAVGHFIQAETIALARLINPLHAAHSTMAPMPVCTLPGPLPVQMTHLLSMSPSSAQDSMQHGIDGRSVVFHALRGTLTACAASAAPAQPRRSTIVMLNQDTTLASRVHQSFASQQATFAVSSGSG
jgi:hypothetical protein